MADVTISGLNSAPSVSLTDVLPISNGSTTYKATVNQILSVSSNAYMVDFLIVAGGGGGGAGAYGGGGGAGGVITGSSYVDPVIRYGLLVGAGGAGGNRGSAGYQQGKNGNNSSFLGFTAVGGGGGGSYNTDRYQFGRPGGSSGGHSGYSNNWQYTNINPCVLGQGNIEAMGATYAGGGGAGGTSNVNGSNATSFGSGGGGTADSNTSLAGGNGSGGIVKLRYFGSTRGSGGTITSAGGYTYHSFTTVGNDVYTA